MSRFTWKTTFAPQLGQTAANVPPHSRQKRAPSRLSAWHRGHFMPELPSTRASEGRNGRSEIMGRTLIWSTWHYRGDTGLGCCEPAFVTHLTRRVTCLSPRVL